ncbi:MAG: restriction endonuclease subunit S [Pseudomonadota bacterium]|nr:restriction endonuclease subunit S [Pseudomonadota bacterium]
MVPNGWTLTSLGKLCDINPKKIKKPENGKVSFIAMNQLSEEGQLISHLPREYEEVSKGFTSFKDGDVLVAKITPCFENGKGALVYGLTNGVGFGSTEFHVLRAKENTSPEFIYYLTRTKELRVRGENNMQGSAGHRRVTADYFNAYKVLTPPLPEQRKIANILSTWDKAISTTERLIDNSKQQKQALMQQLLTGAHTQRKRLLDDSGKPFEGEWEEVKLGDLSTKITKGTTPSTNGFSFQQQGINFVKVESISSTGAFDKSKFAYIDNDCHESFKRSQLEKEDILFSIAGALGRTALVEETILPANTNQALAIVRLDRARSVHRYIIYYLNSPRIASLIKGLTAKAAQPNLSLKDVNGLTILLPSLKEQEKIASVLSNADKEIELLEQQLADLKQEKKALMQQLLTGKRRVKVDDKEVA